MGKLGAYEENSIVVGDCLDVMRQMPECVDLVVTSPPYNLYEGSQKTMIYIEALDTYQGAEKSVFLAGGITGCPNWQADIVQMLAHTNLALLNPRRAYFPIHDPSAARVQIKWEHDRLRQASAILFWFPYETICPIVLYELGAWSMTNKKVFVGVHPQYQRRQDVEIQTQLVRPEVKIVYSLRGLADQVIEWDSLEISERDIY